MNATSRTSWSDLESRDHFARAVRRSQMSYRQIARSVEGELARMRDKERRHRRDPGLVPSTCSYQTIGNFVTGRTSTTRELMGVAIERALGAKDGDLFVPRVARGTNADHAAA